MKIDSHHHFWKYDSVEHSWINDGMKVIRRDFLPEHLLTEIGNAGVDGVVSVQARQNLTESQWLLDFAAQHDFIKGVVAWVNLLSPKVGAELEHFAINRKLKSVRHVVQGEADDNFILRDDFNRGICELKKYSLAYDILIFERHLPQTVKFVDAHPDQIFVLDHIAKPRISDGLFEPWNRNLRELAKRPNVYCKVSGMVTEADYLAWTEAQLRPYFDTVLEAFGSRRLLFGSDWPVCLVACGYACWYKLVSSWAAMLSVDEQNSIFGGAAAAAYKL